MQVGQAQQDLWAVTGQGAGAHRSKRGRRFVGLGESCSAQVRCYVARGCTDWLVVLEAVRGKLRGCYMVLDRRNSMPRFQSTPSVRLRAVSEAVASAIEAKA